MHACTSMMLQTDSLSTSVQIKYTGTPGNISKVPVLKLLFEHHSPEIHVNECILSTYLLTIDIFCERLCVTGC